MSAFSLAIPCLRDEWPQMRRGAVSWLACAADGDVWLPGFLPPRRRWPAVGEP